MDILVLQNPLLTARQRLVRTRIDQLRDVFLLIHTFVVTDVVGHIFVDGLVVKLVAPMIGQNCGGLFVVEYRVSV